MKTVSTAELAQRVARELATPEPQARAVLDRAIDVMKKELQRGNCIELPHFMSVSVKQGQPVATTTQSGGTLGLPATRLVQMDLDDGLRKAIEGPGLFHILLVVPKKNFFTGVMASRLASARSEVTVVQGEAEALERLERSRPDLVVLDVGLEDAPKISNTLKKNRDTSLTSIIAIHPEGTDAQKVKDMVVMPDEGINEPFELTELVRLTESELARCSEERNYFDHVMHWRLQTKEETVEQANDLVAHVLAQSGLPEESAAAFGVAFREAVDNAARHGNKNNENRYIDVQYLLDREKATLAVQDEGEGFDTEIYLSRGVSGSPVDAARQRSMEGGHGGLGIMLMLKCVDKLEYNYAGNKISLTRYIRKS
ncbi:MAG TPA: ATP-binding protein [Planctomycetota bacterium]|jgi:anti-sigma regulatory factor (Ser/Thr protein kinase)/CheY-like chemotaxis protein/nucleoid DNA-binding protein